MSMSKNNERMITIIRKSLFRGMFLKYKTPFKCLGKLEGHILPKECGHT